MLAIAFISATITACTSTNLFKSNEEISPSKIFTATEFESTHGLATRSQFPAADVFKAGDTLDVTVHAFEKFSGTYLVDAFGKTHFVYLGEILVAGLSITDLQNTLREGYGECCLNNPSVSIKKETDKLGRIVVDGAVESPRGL